MAISGRGSRKDFRNSVVAARKAQPGWSRASAYLRGQIIYRIAEMLEGRREQFIAELALQGATERQARKEVDASIDRLIYFAGWADKYQQVFSAVNPVSSSHFNFSVLEATGVALVPGTAFGAPGYVRISFAASMETMNEAIARIKQFVES